MIQCMIDWIKKHCYSRRPLHCNKNQSIDLSDAIVIDIYESNVNTTPFLLTPTMIRKRNAYLSKMQN